ncbi:MAG TPA: DUF2752 domain-containing protein [Bacteroidales bacterium]|nr:MAG: hypothetical protein A2W98_03555 [Bacteroidetes bacterium GWF2_33_38]OFY68189.1 MAG: hypothetical protein A2265_01305 [Bacteroidetes bacterium RIFOXYA12_FULL_33_9]HBF87494.1 DUF2752 domain-containing protein [Bacteroidales bacterium]
MYKIIEWLESHMLPCPWKQYLGIDCLGCGMQRAFIELLKGNLIESINAYPALIPIIFMFSFLPLHLKFKFKHGALVLKISFIFIISIIIINYIYKLLNNNIISHGSI